MMFFQSILRFWIGAVFCVFISGLCLAEHCVFEIEPQKPQFYLKPNMATVKPIYFVVKNTVGQRLTSLSFESDYEPSALFTANLAPLGLEQQCQNGQDLLAGAMCKLYIDLTAGPSLGSQFLAPRVCAFNQWLCSRGMAEVIIVDARNIQIVGSIPTPLPYNTEVNDPTPIVYRFTNASATLLGNNLEVTIGSPELIVQSDGCSGNQLLPGDFCDITCNFTSNQKGKAEPFVTLSYNEGADVVIQANTQVVDVAVHGSVNIGLPSYVKKGTDTPVSFKFTNQNRSVPATGVKLEISSSGTWKPEIDECSGKKILGGDTCLVGGKVNFANLGSQTVSIKFDYKEEGDTIHLTTATIASDLVVDNIGFSLHGTAIVESGNEVRLTDRQQDIKGLVSSDGKLDFTKPIIVTSKMKFSADNNPGAADGIALIMHNDSRGPGVIGYKGEFLGARGIQQGVYYAFADYLQNTLSLRPTNDASIIESITLPYGTSWPTGEYYNVVYRWDPATQKNTIVVTDKSGQPVVTKDTILDIRSVLGGDLGYIALSAATGNSYAEQTVEIISIENN